MIATGVEQDVPTRRAGQGPASWQEIHAAFRGLVEGISRNASLDELEGAAESLSSLANDVLNLLENHLKVTIISANESHDERHKQNSNPNSLIELEPSLREGKAERVEPNPRTSAATERTYPLGMVLSACPDIVDYAKGKIANWRDFLATAAVVRPMLGISPSAWEEARTVMGEAEAAVVVACLLQRSSTIQSAGGYLRELTRKAGEGEFSLGPVLMAQINAKNRERRSA
jgi:replication initiation protein RepC